MSVLTAKLPCRTLVLSPARSMVRPPANSADRSWEKVFCRLMQNLYSSTGTTPMREQAKKPLRILIEVVLMLIFYRHIKYSDNHTCNKERPAEQREEFDSRLNPVKVKDVRPHIAHHGEEISCSIIYRFIKPFEHGVPDGVGYLRAQKGKSI